MQSKIFVALLHYKFDFLTAENAFYCGPFYFSKSLTCHLMQYVAVNIS